MAIGYNVPFTLGSSLGKTGSSAVYIKGHNNAVGASYETIWDQGALYSHMSSASVVSVSSNSANDASGGTGARTVIVSGQLAGVNQSETVTMSGLTGVNTTNQYDVIFSVKVASAGSLDANDGSIYVGTGAIGAGVPAVILCRMFATARTSLSCLWRVPSSSYFALCSFTCSSNVAGCIADLVTKSSGGMLYIVDRFMVGLAPVHVNFSVPLKFNALDDIEVRAVSAGGAAKISASFSGLVVSSA